MQVAEPVHHAGQEEIEGPQPKDCEDVGREDDQRIASDAENGGDAIDGEKQVGAFHDQQDQQRRRDPQSSCLPHEEAAAVVHRGL